MTAIGVLAWTFALGLVVGCESNALVPGTAAIHATVANIGRDLQMEITPVPVGEHLQPEGVTHKFVGHRVGEAAHPNSLGGHASKLVIYVRDMQGASREWGPVVEHDAAKTLQGRWWFSGANDDPGADGPIISFLGTDDDVLLARWHEVFLGLTDIRFSP